MRETTAGQMLVNESLPPDMRDYDRVLDKKGIQKLMDEVARKYPEKYPEIVKNLSDVGRHVAYASGGYGIGLKSLRQTQAAKTARAKLSQELQQVYSNKNLTPDQADAAVLATVGKYQGILSKDVFAEAVAANNPLAMQAVSGARGTPTSVNSLIGADLLYEDHRGKPVPIPILRNYSMGLSPAEHFAGAFGARKGVLDLKKATGDAGFLCLCATTEVRMADNSVKPICAIRVGDEVLGSDVYGRTAPARVTAIFNNGDRALHKFTFSYWKSQTTVVELRATADHKVLGRLLQRSRLCAAADVQKVGLFTLGEMLSDSTQYHSLMIPDDFAGVDRSAFAFHFMYSEPLGFGATFDIEVDNHDHLFVLANGVIVSNSKQLSQAVHRLVVTARDDENPYDETQPRGLEVDTDDPDNEGSLLAHPVGDYKRNTVLTPKILKELKAAGHANILVRSPTVGGPADGGVYSRDTGYREKGGLAPTGDMVGLAGSQAVSEPLTQGQISSKHCLARGTMVRMADWTVKAIEDIVVGDNVLGADSTAMTFPVRVVNTFDNGLRECVSTFFKYPFNRAKHGVTIESTADHKVLMQRRVTGSLQECRNNELQLLPVGTKTGKLCAILPNGYRQIGGVREPLAPIIGMLLGDGCYTTAVNSVNFSCYDELLATDETLLSRAAAENLKLTKLTGHIGDYKFSMIEDDQTDFKDGYGRMMAITRNPLRQWLESRGMFGKYAHEKTLPPDIGTWDIQSICELIGGYFVTDGSVYYPTDHAHRGKPYFGFGSTSETMLIQLRELLVQRLGIYPTGPYGTDSGSRKRTMYYLNINAEDGIRKFAAAIPLYGVKKQRTAAMLASWVVERPHKYYRLPRAASVVIGQRQTYDIEVDHPDHLFVLANGLIVSNSGGVAGASAGAIGGFATINSMVQASKGFQGSAIHSQIDGRVDNIVEAPQGGQYITIEGEQHYVPRGTEITAKKGDVIEAGDMITNGIPNPSEIVKHKGVGEGRKYFVQAFRDVLKGSQIGAQRRNIELLARGLLNHVRLTDEIGDWSPDDIVPYQTLESQWQPRPGYHVAPAKALLGSYLERPVLHYSIGTKIRPSMVKKLDQYGIKSIYAHPEAPPFEPEMVRAMMNTAHDPDWQTKMLGSYQQQSVLEAARRGGVSDAGGTSYVPALAGSEMFGKAGPTKGWDPADIGRKPVDLTAKPQITSILD